MDAREAEAAQVWVYLQCPFTAAALLPFPFQRIVLRQRGHIDGGSILFAAAAGKDVRKGVKPFSHAHTRLHLQQTTR